MVFYDVFNASIEIKFIINIAYVSFMMHSLWIALESCRMLDYFFKNQNMGIKYKFIEESDNDESPDQDQLEDLLYNCKYDTEHNVLVAVLDDIKLILLLYN